MLPYFSPPVLTLGPLSLHAFGVLVAAAVLVGMTVARRRAIRIGLNARHIEGLLSWVVACGFVGGHVIDLLLYEPATLTSHPLQILRIWDGLGSFGGFIGATAGATWYIHRQRPVRPWRYLDVVAYAFPFAWFFGRLGCAVAFDHVGRATNFFLGEVYRDGVVRHNLGLEESLLTIGLAALFYIAGRKERPSGFFIALLALLYAPARFALDSLRIEDARYLGLTPAQYGSILLACIGAVMLVLISRRASLTSRVQCP